MSANLYWRPYVPEPEGESFGYGLKWALAKRLWPDTDGSLCTEWTVVDDRLAPWLAGVRDGGGQGADDAQDLLDLIAKHGQVEIRIY